MGSILSLDRKVLLRSFGGYIPTILGGLAGAAVLGCAIGLVFGVKPIDMVIKYVLPIMGGGNGAGAVPLSQIYEQISGEPAANYYSFAIIILTIANLFCIIAGALLNRLGQMKPSLTGDGTNIMPVDSKLIKEDVKIKVTLNDYTGALLLCGTIYAVGRLFSKVLLPTVLGAQIHTFAYSSAMVGKLVGFYPIDAAVTAGLCMANRGGLGDIAVLGAAHRLDLISYAQLSSRVGGGIVLIIASFFFSFFL